MLASALRGLKRLLNDKMYRNGYSVTSTVQFGGERNNCSSLILNTKSISIFYLLFWCRPFGVLPEVMV
jgi:hypothetical protein